MQSVISIAEDVLFDRRHGLETAEIVEVRDLDICDDDKRHCIQYQPTRVRHFRKLMRALQLPTTQVFVDVGCGKGRILVAAAQYGFHRIVGVEISPQLCAAATRNVDIFRRRSGTEAEIEVACLNVLHFDLRNDEGIFYLYWPFDRVTMIGFIEKVRESLHTAPREVWLIVNDFRYQDLFEQDEYFAYRGRIVYGGGEFDIYQHRPEECAALDSPNQLLAAGCHGL
jgi:SAM-dependent methyltransferase